MLSFLNILPWKINSSVVVNLCLFTDFRTKVDKSSDLSSPPGYNPSVGQVFTETSRENDSNHLIIKKSWDLALGPLKQVSPSKLFVRL